MKIIFIDEKHAASTSVVLKGWVRLGLSLCMLGIPVFLGFYGFQFAEARGNQSQKDEASQAWADGLREQKADLERVRQRTLTQALRYGKTTEIDHGSRYDTLYAHARKLLVNAGDVVKRGQIIALSGFAGRSTGPHVRFKVHKHGRVVDPASYIHTTSR